MKLNPFITLIALVALLPLGCATSSSSSSSPSSSNGATLTGTITYQEKVALPADAEVMVYLIENTDITLPADVVTSKTIKTAGPVPIPFSLPYEPSQIKANNRYSVGARILSGGKVWMRAASQQMVITKGTPTSGILLELIRPNE